MGSSVLKEKAKQANLLAYQKLTFYLNQFYLQRDIPANNRLIIQENLYGQCLLTNRGVVRQEWLEKDAKKQSLMEYQNEMQAFSQFLKEQFFQS